MAEGFFKGKGVRTSKSQGAIDALSKVKEKTWKEMKGAFNSINEVVKSGGFKELMGGTTASIKENLKTQVTGIFSPITNEINTFVANLTKETGLGDAFNKIGNSLGNLLNTVLAPDTGIGQAVNFIGDAVANTLDFAAKGWESLLTGRNAFQAEYQETILPTTGGGTMAGSAQGYFDGTPLDMDILLGMLEDSLEDLDLGF